MYPAVPLSIFVIILIGGAAALDPLPVDPSDSSPGVLTLPPYTLSKWHADFEVTGTSLTVNSMLECDYFDVVQTGWRRSVESVSAYIFFSASPNPILLRLDPTNGETLWTQSVTEIGSNVIGMGCVGPQVILATATGAVGINISTGATGWIVYPASGFTFGSLITLPPAASPQQTQQSKPYVYLVASMTFVTNYSLVKVDVPSGSTSAFTFALAGWSLNIQSLLYYNSSSFEMDYMVGLLSGGFGIPTYLVIVLNDGRTKAMTTTLVSTTAYQLQTPFYVYSDVAYFYYVDAAGYEVITGFGLLNGVNHYTYRRYAFLESAIQMWTGHINGSLLSTLTFVLLRDSTVQFVSGAGPFGALQGSVNCSYTWTLLLSSQPSSPTTATSFGDGDWFLYEDETNTIWRLSLAAEMMRWGYTPARTLASSGAAYLLPDGNLYLQTSSLSGDFATGGYLLQLRVSDAAPLVEFYFSEGGLTGLAWSVPSQTPSDALLLAATSSTARGLLPAAVGSVLRYPSLVTATRPVFLGGQALWGADDTLSFTHGSSITAVTAVGTAGTGFLQWATRWTVDTNGAATFSSPAPLSFQGYYYYYAQFNNDARPYKFIRVHAATGSWDTITLTREELDGCDPSGLDSALVGDAATGSLWWIRGSCVVTMDVNLVFTGVDLSHSLIGDPIIVGQTVYVMRSDGYVTSLDTLFLGISGYKTTSNRALAASPSPMLLLGDSIFFTCGQGTTLLVQYDLQTLTLQQFQRVGPLGTPLTSNGVGELAPFLYGENMFLLTNYGSLIQMTPWNGTYVRGFEVFTAANTTLGYPAITGEGIFIFGCAQGLFAITSWGSLVWSTTFRPETGDLLQCGAPHIRGTTVVVGCNNQLRVVNLYTGEVMLSGPEGPLQGALLVSPRTGGVYAFDANQIWYVSDNYQAFGAFPSQPEPESHAGTYAGIVILILILIALVAVVGVLVMRKRKNQPGTQSGHSEERGSASPKASEKTPLLAAEAPSPAREHSAVVRAERSVTSSPQPDDAQAAEERGEERSNNRPAEASSEPVPSSDAPAPASADPQPNDAPADPPSSPQPQQNEAEEPTGAGSQSG